MPFHARQGCAKTEVRRIAESQVTVIFSRDVEAVRIREALWVAIRRRHDCDHSLTFLDQLATHFPVRRTHPRRMLAGAFVAKHFLDRRRDQGQIAPQSPHLCGIAQQREYAISNQVRGSFLPTHHGHNAVRDHFFFGELVPVALRGQQRVNQSLARILALLPDGILKVSGEIRDRFQHARVTFRVVLEIAQHLGEIRGP